jgi:hypothetical protein
LAFQHESILAKDEAIAGDINTSFFHQSIIKRARKNIITHFKNPDGTFSTTQDQLARTINQYFIEIFRSQGSSSVGSQHQEWAIEPNQNQAITNDSFTNSTPDLQEIHSIIRNMRSNAAPRPDGLNVAFYKASWEWISNDVYDLVSFFITLVPCVLRLTAPT